MRQRKRLGGQNEVGATIAHLRRERGWTQGDLRIRLELLGIHLSARRMSEIEGQQREVRGVELKAFAEIFGVTIDQLYRPPPRR